MAALSPQRDLSGRKIFRFFGEGLPPLALATYIPDATEKAARRADFPGSPAYDVPSAKGRSPKNLKVFFLNSSLAATPPARTMERAG